MKDQEINESDRAMAALDRAEATLKKSEEIDIRSQKHLDEAKATLANCNSRDVPVMILSFVVGLVFGYLIFK